MIVCKENEVLNPKTNRCVKRTGKIGKAILQKIKTPTIKLYRPAYLGKPETTTKTLKAYIKEQNQSAPINTLQYIKRLIETIILMIVETTVGCVLHYHQNKTIRRGDVLHTLGMFHLDIHNQKEDKEFTAIVRKLVRDNAGPDIKMEASVYTTISRALLPLTTMTPPPSFLEKLRSLRPSTQIESISLWVVGLEKLA